MSAIVIYGPGGSGKTFNADAFAKHYGKTKVFDAGLRPRMRQARSQCEPLPHCDKDTLIIANEPPPPNDPRRWIHVDDAMQAIGKKPFRLSSAGNAALKYEDQSH